MERRTRYDIYQDILETVLRRGAIGITRISYGANLPVDRAKDAVEFLMENRLLDNDEYGGSIKYIITGRGGEFLNALKTVKRYIKKGEF
jgi:predicted transcriptional regulator